MAISGSFYGTTSNPAIKPKITWEAVANLEGNYSDVTATLSYSRTDGYTTSGHWAGTLTIGEDTGQVSGHYMQITRDSNTLAITHTARVYHKEDGTQTVTISAQGRITETTLSSTSISGEITLEAIPRAAEITATDAYIGAVSVVTIARKSDQYSYTVAYTFGGLTGYLSPSGISETAVKFNASSVGFTLPEDFYYEIPNAAEGICTLKCTTYLGGTAVGEAKQTQFTVRADPKWAAPLARMTVTDSNPVTQALTGNDNWLVRYASNALCKTWCQACYGASITERKISGRVLTEDSLTIPGIQVDTLRFAVRDSRGFQSEYTVEPVILDYFPPTAAVSAVRKDATGGEAVLQVSGSFWSGSFGAAENSLRLRWKLGDGQIQEATGEIQDNTYTFTQTLTGLDYTQSFPVWVEVSDSVQTLERTTQIHPGVPIFDWGKTDVAFHVPVLVQGKDLLALLEQAASKEYADGKLAVHRLWSNPGSNASFAAQTVSLDLSNYSGVSICYKGAAYSNFCKTTGFIPKGNTGILDFVNTAPALQYRKFQVREDGVVFGPGYTGEAANPGYGIPLVIYGWMGVTDPPVPESGSAICGQFLCGGAVCGTN